MLSRPQLNYEPHLLNIAIGSLVIVSILFTVAILSQVVELFIALGIVVLFFAVAWFIGRTLRSLVRSGRAVIPNPFGSRAPGDEDDTAPTEIEITDE